MFIIIYCSYVFKVEPLWVCSPTTYLITMRAKQTFTHFHDKFTFFFIISINHIKHIGLIEPIIPLTQQYNKRQEKSPAFHYLYSRYS